MDAAKIERDKVSVEKSLKRRQIKNAESKNKNSNENKNEKNDEENARYAYFLYLDI